MFVSSVGRMSDLSRTLVLSASPPPVIVTVSLSTVATDTGCGKGRGVVEGEWKIDCQAKGSACCCHRMQISPGYNLLGCQTGHMGVKRIYACFGKCLLRVDFGKRQCICSAG